MTKRFFLITSLYFMTFFGLETVSFFCTTWYSIVSFVSKCVICAYVVDFLKDVLTEKILGTKINPEGKAVFITGCDSGFGHRLAKLLDSRNYKVFAGCLFPEEGGALELQNACSQNLQILQLDVTKDDSVQKAKAFVQGNLANCELWAIVNNSGIFRGFNISVCPVDHFKDALEVNTLGVVRVTKAFLPLLRLSKGRIINVNSLAGRISHRGMAAYCMSKHAAVSFNTCLKQEMEKYGVKVISVEPEFFQTSLTATDMVHKLWQDALKKMDENQRKHYEQQNYDISKNTNYVFKISSPKVNIVIDTLETAISSEHPAPVYKVCRRFFMKLVFYIFENVSQDVRDSLVPYIS